MSQWNHAICELCWHMKNPDYEPTRLKKEFATVETCCFCGEATDDGIYLRYDPNGTRCKGKGKVHE